MGRLETYGTMSHPSVSIQHDGQPPSASGSGDIPNPEINQQYVSRVAIKPPPFWKSDPKLWFIQLEAQFELSHIVLDGTKYNHVLSAIDTDILTQVTDFLINPPQLGKYEGIKNRLISIYSDSSEKKLRKLLSETSLGDRKPSQLLNEMTRLGGSSVSQEILKTLWLQHLPTQIQSVLAASSDSLENLSKMADKIAEIEQPQSFAVATDNHSNLVDLVQKLAQQVEELKLCQNQNTFRRNRSRTPHRTRLNQGNSTSASNLCWYHAKYKDKANKCVPPCSFSNQENDQPRI